MDKHTGTSMMYGFGLGSTLGASVGMADPSLPIRYMGMHDALQYADHPVC